MQSTHEPLRGWRLEGIPPNDLDEEPVEVLQSLIVGLQCLDQLPRRVDEFLGQCHSTDLLQ